VDEELPEAERVTEVGTKLEERDQPWNALIATWENLGDQPQLVVIKGEAGIGKTYLAEEFLREVRRKGIKTLHARSYPAGRELAYSPLTDLLRSDLVRGKFASLEGSWLRELSRLLPEIRDQFPDVPVPEELSESWQLKRLLEASARLLLSGEGNLAILLDDLQWFDRETLAWLRFLLKFDSPTRLLVVGTLRSEELTSDSFLNPYLLDLAREGKLTEIELDRLSLEGTGLLASQLWGEKLPQDEIQRLYQETQGNPLFVAEMVRAGFITQARGSLEDWSLPPKVQAVIESRLNTLTADARKLADVAAVVGRDFSYELLTEVGEVTKETSLQALDELWGRRIIQDQGDAGYSFQHDKFQEVIYQQLSPHRRRHLHLQVANALLELSHEQPHKAAPRLAYHYQLSGDKEKALDQYLLAGDQARTLYAREDAVEYYQAAADLLGNKPDPRRIHLYRGWGNALFKLARYEESVACYQKVFDIAQEEQDSRSQALAWLAIGKVRDRQGEFKDALKSADRAYNVAQKNGLKQELADSRLLQGQSHYRLGQVDQAEPLIQSALDLHRKREDAFGEGRCLNLLGLVADVRGKYQKAREYKREAIRVFEEIGGAPSRWWIGNLTLNLAITADLEGDYKTAINLYQEAMANMEEVGDQDWIITCLFNLGAAYVNQGEYDQAEDHLGQVLALTEGMDWLGLSLTYYYLAESYLGQGQIKYATKAALQALDLARKSGAQEHLGAAWRALGKAASSAGKVVEINGNLKGAGSCFKISRDIFDEIGAEGEKAHTLRDWGEHELAQGDQQLGEGLRAEARTIYEKLNMQADLKRMG
jgi:predicted ATPase